MSRRAVVTMQRAIGVLAVAGVALLLVLLIAWQYRLELVVWGMPRAMDLLDPIAANEPITWAQGPSSAAVPPRERPPNIILFLTDDMGFNDISLHNGGAGDGSVMTPTIDALARDGVHFRNGYSANAV